jgi:hypothetical protein
MVRRQEPLPDAQRPLQGRPRPRQLAQILQHSPQVVDADSDLGVLGTESLSRRHRTPKADIVVASARLVVAADRGAGAGPIGVPTTPAQHPASPLHRDRVPHTLPPQQSSGASSRVDPKPPGWSHPNAFCIETQIQSPIPNPQSPISDPKPCQVLTSPQRLKFLLPPSHQSNRILPETTPYLPIPSTRPPSELAPQD